jgi:hypothetical protein
MYHSDTFDNSLGHSMFQNPLVVTPISTLPGSKVKGSPIKATPLVTIVEEQLRRRRWTREQLTGWRKRDKRKVRIALRLRRETTMTPKWIAEQLAMGTWANAARRLYEAKT